MKRSFFFRLLAVGFVLFGCKSVGHRSSEVESLNGPRDRSDELHDAVVRDLMKHIPRGKGSDPVWFESTMQMNSDWLIQSPEGVWSRPESSLPKNIECKVGEPGCDGQFTRHLCSSDSDCVPYNTTCQAMYASVVKPGQSPKKMCLGAGDHLLNRFYLAITSAKTHVDITTLSLPTGRFYPMLVNAMAYLSHKTPAPTIRILSAGRTSKSLNVLNPPKDIANELVEAIGNQRGDMEALRFDYGYLADKSLQFSWNHSKIVIADTDRVITGGHNLYDPDYLEDHAVFDASLEFKGPAARGVQDFVNHLWTKVNRIWFGRYPSPHSWTMMTIPDLQPVTPGNLRMIGVGRLGTYGANASDIVFESLFNNANKSIYIAQEDIFSKIPVSGVKELQQWFDLSNPKSLPMLANAMFRGVKVRIVQTDQAGEGLNGYGMMNADEAQKFLIRYLVDEATKRKIGLPAGKTLAQYVCSLFEIAPWRYFANEPVWGASGRHIGSHPKLIVADESAFYLGSHNLYPANLQEFGVVVTEGAVTKQLLDSYWNKIWSNSAPGILSCDRPDSELLPNNSLWPWQ